MKVKFFDLERQYLEIQEELEEAVLRVLRSRNYILGEETEKLEAELAEYCGTKYAVGVSSGSDALLASLMVLGIGEGDEVVTTDYSFFATAGSIARTGAKIKLADADPISYNIDPNQIEDLIGPKTKAIIPVHLYGQCADMDPIKEIADRRGLFVIEDAAQAIGAEYKNGAKAGSFGVAGCFSFYPTKNLGGLGDGGLITTNDKDLYEKLKIARNHGMRPKYEHKFIGGNFRLDAIQAAGLRVKFKNLERWNEKRRKNAELYDKLFIESGLASDSETNGDKDAKAALPKALYKDSGVKNYHIYHQYALKVKQRDELRKFLSENGIGTEIYYPIPFHRQECFKDLGYKASDFPVSNELAAATLALPIYPELKREEIELVVEKIEEFYRNSD